MRILKLLFLILSCFAFSFAPISTQMTTAEFARSISLKTFSEMDVEMECMQFSLYPKTMEKPSAKFNPLDTEFSMLKVRDFLKPDEMSRLLPAARGILGQNLAAYKALSSSLLVTKTILQPALGIHYEANFPCGNSRYCLHYTEESMKRIFKDFDVTDEQHFLSGSSGQHANIGSDQCIFEWHKKYGGIFSIKIFYLARPYYIVLYEFKTIS